MRIRTFAASSLTAVLTAASFAVIADPAAAATLTNLGTCANSSIHIMRNQELVNGSFRLVMQDDGNLVEYDAADHPLWDSGTFGHANAWAVQQTDGNLVVYSATGKPLWASYPPLRQGSYRLCVLPSGNVVTYTAAGATDWATNSVRSVGATRSANLFPKGQCTYYAEDAAYVYAGHYPDVWGDAQYWNTSAARAGYDVDRVPHTDSIVVFEPGFPGTDSTGHVAFVSGVYPAAGTIRISELNYNGSTSPDTRTVSGVWHNSDVEFIALNP